MAAQKVVDKRDADLARAEYIGAAWGTHFSSKKSGRMNPMTKDQEIAVRYRKHKGIPSLYDAFT